jgi:Tfp pilus assembly protein PilO
MSRKMRMLLSGGALVVIVALAWFFLISPLRADIDKTDAAIAIQSAKLADAQAELARAESTRAEGKRNQARLLELAKMVPEAGQVPSLLVQIQDLADQSGIEFISVSPGAPKESEGFQIIPLQLEFSGTYFDLSDFAYRVEQAVAAPGRLLTVKSVELQLGDASDEGSGAVKDSPDLNVSMTLYAFSMDPDAAGQPAESTKSASAGTSVSSAGDTTSTTAK